MVSFTHLLGAAAILASAVSAAPMPDSATGAEVAVSAPNGVIMSDTAALASATATAAKSSSTDNGSSGYSSGGSSYSPPMDSGSSMSPPPMESNPPSWSGSSGSGSYGSGSSGSGMYGSGSSGSGMYGSGSSSMGNSGYDSCVQQCIANFGQPPSSYTPPSGSYGGGSSGSGTGATHTVIVAPTQGVLRYVPFAVNASVGDTIMFMWGANNHTVTKSSSLLPCNKTEDAPFTSGEQNKDFMFSQTVNSTDTLFYYCGTPTHCQKGMFGIINPPNAFDSSSSVNQTMSAIVTNSSQLSAMASYTDKLTANSTGAANWGSSIDLSQMPAWSHEFVISNVMYTRAFLGANPDTLHSDGTVNLGAAGSNPIMVPQDIAATVNSDASTSSAAATASSSGYSSMSASSSTPSASAGASKSGAGALASPRILVGVMAIVATFFAL
jgi:plastocyanin